MKLWVRIRKLTIKWQYFIHSSIILGNRVLLYWLARRPFNHVLEFFKYKVSVYLGWEGDVWGVKKSQTRKRVACLFLRERKKKGAPHLVSFFFFLFFCEMAWENSTGERGLVQAVPVVDIM